MSYALSLLDKSLIQHGEPAAAALDGYQSAGADAAAIPVPTEPRERFVLGASVESAILAGGRAGMR